MTSSEPPILDPSVVVDPDLELDSLWERFELFEALHFGLRIASPMSSADVDQVIELLQPSLCGGGDVLDLACGTGELLTRLAAAMDGASGGVHHPSFVGVDLSPWMLNTAARNARAASGSQRPNIEWHLASAKHFASAKHIARSDGYASVQCLGASWVWLGLEGTIRTLAQSVKVGGRVAIGDMHRRAELSATALHGTHGTTLGPDEIEGLLRKHGLEPVGVVTTSDSDWEHYRRASSSAFGRWRDTQSYAADRYDADHAAWLADQRRDQEVLCWSVSIAERIR